MRTGCILVWLPYLGRELQRQKHMRSYRCLTGRLLLNLRLGGLSPALLLCQEFADTSIPPLTSLYSVASDLCPLPPLVLEDRSPVSSRASQLAPIGQQTVFKSEHFTKCPSSLAFLKNLDDVVTPLPFTFAWSDRVEKSGMCGLLLAECLVPTWAMYVISLATANPESGARLSSFFVKLLFFLFIPSTVSSKVCIY